MKKRIFMQILSQQSTIKRIYISKAKGDANTIPTSHKQANIKVSKFIKNHKIKAQQRLFSTHLYPNSILGQPHIFHQL
jgi:hypothetical protein